MKYKVGQMVYFIENGMRIRNGWIISKNNGRYTVRLNEEKDVAIRLPESRLFLSEEDAIKSVGYVKPLFANMGREKGNAGVRLH